MSGKDGRESRREESAGTEGNAQAAERRQQLIKLSSALAFLAVVAVAVLIVISQNQGNGDGGDASDVQGAAEIQRQLSGIPQQGLVLGRPEASVTLVEFGDLQCPFCKGYAEEILPPVIEGRVRDGEAKIEFRNYTIIGPQSPIAGAGAIAAGEQGRGWNFVELFYRNQGRENAGYVTDSFLTAIAEAAGVPDIDQWNEARESKRVANEVAKTTTEAQRLDFNGTPSFAIEGPSTNGLAPIGTPESTESLESAIADAAEK